MKHIVIVVSSFKFLLSHRSEIVLEAVNKGYQVTLVTHVDTVVPDGLSNRVCIVDFKFHRSGINLYKELKTLFMLYNLLHDLKPDLMHLVTIKPVLYGGLLNHLVRSRAVIFAISGLGTIFSSKGLWSGIRRLIVKGLYKLALSHKIIKVIFITFGSTKI